MKKIFTLIFTAVLALSTAISVQASPAYPHPIKYTQPDGSVITIQLHGDEFYSWVTGENGNEIELGEDGFYRKVINPLSPEMKSIASAESPVRTGLDIPSEVAKTGSPHFLILLIEFQNLEFTINDTRNAFINMLNQTGYSYNGAIGSVAEYFSDCSCGQFTPVFDVFGPIKVASNYEFYGADETIGGKLNKYPKAGRALVEACAYLDNEIDFSIYDADNNGSVDNIFFFFAGHNQAEGASSDTIWPHKWSYPSCLDSGASSTTVPGTNYTYRNIKFDGKTLSTYGCTSEYPRSNGTKLAGIGTFCHEFSHTLGLHDFYDTDYGENGEGDGLFSYSIMSRGNYNDDGRKPPYYSTIERSILGWKKNIPLLQNGDYTLQGVQNNEGYMTKTESSNEYFVYEARTGYKWDEPIDRGLLIYHVDRLYDWDNSREAHPAVYFKAAKPISIDPPHTYESYVPYPGSFNQTTFGPNSPSKPTSWSGTWNGDQLTNISYSNNKVTFTYSNLKDARSITGTVSNPAINLPLSGLTVKLKYSENAGTVTKSATTDENGSFSFDITGVSANAFNISVSAAGYLNTIDDTFAMDGNLAEKTYYLYPAIGEDGYEFKKYRTNEILCLHTGASTINAAIRFTKEEMKPYVGEKISAITIFPYGDFTSIYAVVYFGNTLAEKVRIDSYQKASFNKVILPQPLTIPSDQDVHVGFLLEGCSTSDENYPIVFDEKTSSSGGLLYRTSESSQWVDLSSLHGNLFLSFVVGGVVQDKMYQNGYSGLGLEPGKIYTKGQSISLSIVDSNDAVSQVNYYLNGEPVQGSSVTPATEGDHEIKAEVTYSSGKKETIIQVIKVQ